jgi:hypothetical protein
VDGSSRKQTSEAEIRVNTTKPKQIDTKNLGGSEKGFISVGNYELDGDTLRICPYLVRTDQAPGEVRDRRGVGVGTRSVEAREEVTVKADPVGTPNHRLLGGSFTYDSYNTEPQTEGG